MVSTGNGEGVGSSLTHPVDCETSSGFEINRHVSLEVSTSRKGLLSDERSPRESPENGNSFSSRLRFLKFGHRGNQASSEARLGQIAEGKDEVSRSVPSSRSGIRKRIDGVLFRKIDWYNVAQLCKEWVRKPLNMVLLLWILGVVVSGAILFLVLTGMLNRVLPKKSERDMWFEVNNQIINALFTLMCLYQHPKRFHQLVLLCRWKPGDVSQLRKIYCKNGTYKPNERTHLMVVIILLHVNCFSQYALCGLNLGYKRSDRPVIGAGVCLSVAIAAPAIALLYCVLSPLGKDYEDDANEEAPEQHRRKSLEKRFILAPREELGSRTTECKPEWRGGLFHLWEDFGVAYLSSFCCFCVFGWNMERLGFGNMYVHIATFLLLCMAPFWIFNLAAVNIDNETVREILGITGIALCLFGLLYGGFWRIKMRKRFNLPPNNACFGKPDVADCVQWLFCCWCSLAQEVRTGDFYVVVEERVHGKQSGDEFDGHTPLTPLPREGSTAAQPMSSDLGSSFWMNSSMSKIKPSIPMDEIMSPPSPPAMRKEVDMLREI